MNTTTVAAYIKGIRFRIFCSIPTTVFDCDNKNFIPSIHTKSSTFVFIFSLNPDAMMKPAYNTDNLYKKLINIYTEAVPNPDAMKFVANTMLAANEETVKDYPNAASATDSPLAQELFKFPFVQRVFIANNFVTITKDEASDWVEHIPVIRHFLKNYLEEGSPVFENNAAANAPTADLNNSEAVKKIKSILDEYIRPAVEMDGGHIMFHSFEPETGVVKVLLQGSCSGCPSSTITLKSGIENLLTRMMPGEVKAVVAEGI